MNPHLQEEQVELEVERLGIHGEGIARLNGLAIFIDGVLPGEKVTASICDKRKTFARALPISWKKTSPDRETPVCPLFGSCGGCQLMHLTYEKQLEAKRERVADALERIGKLKIDVPPCLPSPTPLGYRNKIQLPVNDRGQLGLYARNSHDLIEIEQCYIHSPLGEKVLGHIQTILNSFPEVKDLKHVLIKTAVKTEQVLVVLVTKNSRLLTSLAKRIREEAPEVLAVVQNINPSDNNTILSANFKVLSGNEWIEERLCNLTFRVSAASFFQVNPAQAELLYEKVLELASLTGKETVLDAYSGVGTLSLILAQKAKKVIGIESVPQAIKDAKDNARLNNTANIKWICGKAEEKISLLEEQIDIATVNPPRKGCEQAFIKALIAKAPKRIIYISCDPATLARDLAILCEAGYHLKSVQPFDMFPQTMHVESVALLELKLQM